MSIKDILSTNSAKQAFHTSLNSVKQVPKISLFWLHFEQSVQLILALQQTNDKG